MLNLLLQGNALYIGPMSKIISSIIPFKADAIWEFVCVSLLLPTPSVSYYPILPYVFGPKMRHKGGVNIYGEYFIVIQNY